MTHFGSVTYLRSLLATGLCLVVFGAIGVTNAEAQDSSGRIAGQVLDSQNGKALSTAQVAIVETGTMVLSDLEGRYFIPKVPAGQYSLAVSVLGYATKTVTGVRVLAGETEIVDIALDPSAIELETLTVTAEAERGATSTLLEKQRTAVSVTEAVGSQEIAKSPDSDAAEVATRVAGVTVTDGRYVYVRGLGERYSQTSLNGSPVPSPQPEKEVVPLDLFPAEFLASLSTQKTYTPDRPAEFSGGVVDIQNKEFPNQLQFKFQLSTAVNDISQFQDGYLDYKGSATDWAGIDDGARQIPDVIQDNGYGIGGDRLPSSDPSAIQTAGQSFAGKLPQFTPTRRTTPMNLGLGASVGNRTTLFGNDFGYFLAGTYAANFRQRQDETEQKWRASAFDPEFAANSQPNVDYDFQRGMGSVAWGLVGNLNYLFNPSNQIGLQTLLNLNTDNEAREYIGANREDLGGEVFSERLRFQSRVLGWGQLSGKHQFQGANSRLDWRLSGARATRDEPGLRETVYSRAFNSNDAFVLDGNTGESGRYFYTDLTDDDFSGGADWTWNYTGSGNPANLKVGIAGRQRNRDFAARRYRWRFTSGVTDLDSVVAMGNIVGTAPRNPDELQLSDIVENGDQYTADETTTAVYAMWDLPVGTRWQFVVGARVEDYRLKMEEPSQGTFEILTDLDQTDILPALNVNYRLTPDQNIRFAASRTLDRPEFRELAPFQFTEASSLRQVNGNPDLQIADIINLDAKWEWFPRPGEVLSGGVFYKHFDGPIEQVYFAAASSLYSYQNSESAWLAGIEMSARKRLDFSEFWSHFTLGAGLAFIESQVTVIPGNGFFPTNIERPLQGQSPYTVNANLVWLSSGGATEFGLFYGVFGERITAAGGSGIPDIIEQPRHSLDLTWRQQLTPRWSLKLKGVNLLDEPFRWNQTANGITRDQRFYRVGRTIAISLSYGN